MSTIKTPGPVTEDWDCNCPPSLVTSEKLHTCTPTPSPNDSTASKGLLDIDWVTHPDQALYVQLALRLHRIFQPNLTD